MSLSGYLETSGPISDTQVFVAKNDGTCICMAVWADNQKAMIRVGNLHKTDDWLQIYQNQQYYFTVDGGILDLWFRMTNGTFTPTLYWGVVRGGI